MTAQVREVRGQLQAGDPVSWSQPGGQRTGTVVALEGEVAVVRPHKGGLQRVSVDRLQGRHVRRVAVRPEPEPTHPHHDLPEPWNHAVGVLKCIDLGSLIEAGCESETRRILDELLERGYLAKKASGYALTDKAAGLV